MRFRVLSFTLALAALFVARISVAQTIGEKADAAMHRVFGAHAALQTVKVPIDAAVAKSVEACTNETVRDHVLVHEASENGKIVGYGIVDDVPGKAQPITYITLLSPSGEIQDIEILVYREPYGGEVQYETFRKQFRGKTSKSTLRVGRDIQNMAGATISSKAVTNGAKKIAVLFDELRKAHKL
jgi:Na+-translocating ferredoxin:NAD+ oxidoreductase RnfG subunit